MTQSTKRLRLAVVATVFRPLAHADVILSRWFDVHAGDEKWGWRGSQCEIATLFVAQTPDNDMARDWCEKYGVRQADSIAEALTLGGETLAVDGVLLIAEHGDYPWNEQRQKLYPRREFFDEVAAVFRDSGRAVPVFFDKHLSWNSGEARAMAATIDELAIPFLGGSSLPHVGFRPALPTPDAATGATLFSLFPGGAESYGYHSIEIALRARAALGLLAEPTSVTVWRGEAVWQQLENNAHRRALTAAILPATTRFGDVAAARAAERREIESLEDELLFCIEFADETESLHLRLADGRGEFGTTLMRNDGTIWTGLVAAGDADNFYAHFATQNALIEAMMWSGQSSVPLKRSLCSTLLINRVMDALQTPGLPLEYGAETPKI